MRPLITTALGTFAADQITKWVVLGPLDLENRLVLDVLPPFVNLRMAWNTGINFGLFGGADAKWLLIALALVVSGFVLWWVRRDGGGRWMQIAAGLLVGGALGNVVDRVRFGAVADFLNMSCCGIENPYAFNIADIAIFAGAVGLILIGDGGTRRNRRKAP